MLQELYSFKIKDSKEVAEKTKEKRKNADGVEEEVEITKKVNKEIPYTIIIKEPTRRELEEADMEYSIEMSRCIKKGILTKAMLAKKYSDTGGILSESDAKKLMDLYSELSELEGEFTKKTLAQRNVKKMSKKAKEDISVLSSRVAMVRRDIVTLESAYQTLFNHTADTKAQNRIILWYIANLTHFKTEGADPEPLFEGKTFEEKIDSYYIKDEQEDSLFQLAAGKLASIVSYWYFSNEPEKEDFDKIIDDINRAAGTEEEEQEE